MVALDRAGAEMVMMAPDRDQMDVVDHRTGQATGETRNVLTESARIARGDIRDVKTVKAAELDAIILPGGFGAAKNLCNFATAGDQCEVDDGVAQLLRDMRAAGKPIGALCIAPALLARVFGADYQPKLTIGNDAGTAAALESMGARHAKADVVEVVVDRDNSIVTTPCYMLAGRIGEVATGTERAVAALLKLAEAKTGATV
jgi:enhancing lycopene biosynthesis protein 2